MTQNQFNYFYSQFQDLNRLLELAENEKKKSMSKDRALSVYKKMNEYKDLKNKIIRELSEINPGWTARYNEYDNHPIRMKPFPEIYDLTELDDKNFNFFYKEYEKLNNLFKKAYFDPEKYESKKFGELNEDEEDFDVEQIDEDVEKKLDGMIGHYYSLESVLEYNRQEEKIINELSKINQKWLENKNDRQLVKYDGGFNVKTFEHPLIYKLFEKIVKCGIEIQELKLKDENSYKITSKEYEFENIKKEIIDFPC